ncbi:hypothetical protein OAJ35_02790 [Gammaproteobacteria bacterium]|nr:hypothetical protein [Gammaproteobacteria bacterium]
MIFKKLILNNWIPYKDTTEVDFSTHTKKNITLIRGNNKGGKSAVIRSLKWVLYGNTGDISEYQGATKLINREAYNQKDFTSSVKLHISSQKKEIIISRELSVLKGINNPQDKDFQEDFSVMVDGKAQVPPEKYVKDLLDESISRFFLFDGEMLQDYKDLVDNPKESKELQEHIERVLRTPQLKSAKFDLNTITRRISADIAKSTKDATLKNMLDTINEFEEKRDLKLEEKDELQVSLGKSEEEHKKIQSDLDQLTEERKDLDNLSSLKESLPDLENEIVTKKEKIQDLSKDSWRLVLAPKIERKIKDIHSQKKRLMKEEDKVLKLKSLNKSIQLGKCFTCGKTLSKEERKKIEIQIEDLLKEGLEENLTQKLDEDLKKLNEINLNLSLDNLEQEYKELYELRNKKASTEVEIDNLSNSLGDKEGEVGILMTNERNLDFQNQQTKRALSDLSSEIDDLNGEIEKSKKMKDKLSKSSSSALDKLNDLCSILEKVFDDSIKDLSLEIKEKIEKHANFIYPQMTVEETNNSLSISDSFGLSVVDSNNENITTSAGGNQIVALSLLYGLKKSTDIEGPLIIDTPLGRIDEDHRKLILEALPTMGTQCILLVHSGEIKAKGDLEKLISGKIGIINEIHKDSDTVSSITKQ